MPYPTDSTAPARRPLRVTTWNSARAIVPMLTATFAAASLLACGTSSSGGVVMTGADPAPAATASREKPDPDPRVGLRAGMFDAGQASWNMRLVSETPAPSDFRGITNSDLAFKGPLVFQGNYNGYQVWDISNPGSPVLRTAYVCPASQSDVSVYRNLLFVSGEGLSGRIDCGTEGVRDTVSTERLRGLRIFDISDLNNPVNVGNVQTCRGSHTHSLLVDPDDSANVYVYISGSAGVRSPSELAGCSEAMPDEDPRTALFRIEVIKVPLADPASAAIVSSPRIFGDLVAPPRHGEAPEDVAAAAERAAAARERGAFTATVQGMEVVVGSQFTRPLLDSIVKARQGAGAPTSADSAALREALPGIVARMVGEDPSSGPQPGPTQCHDITLYPAIDRAGGACEGYGMLIDISDPVNPVRIDAVSDSNFSYWHSATFNNDGDKVLFSDEWGGGSQAKCRATDKLEWGADAIFTIENDEMTFESYFKMPAAQTRFENCVAHNGSLIPIPGRDVMVQAWYQGGISVFDWTDAENPQEIAYFDRGPVDSTRLVMGGSWSVYWYNGVIVSSEIARGLDVFMLTPSGFISQNEIDAARTVKLDYLNPQGQPKFEWPPSFARARAFVDQLERSGGLNGRRVRETREALTRAENASGGDRRTALALLVTSLERDAASSSDAEKVRMLVTAVQELADEGR